MTAPVFRTWFKSPAKAQKMYDAMRTLFGQEVCKREMYIEITDHSPIIPDLYSNAGFTWRIVTGNYTGNRPTEQLLSTALLIGEALKGYNQVSLQGEDFRHIQKNKLEKECRTQDMIFLETVQTLRGMGIDVKVSQW